MLPELKLAPNATTEPAFKMILPVGHCLINRYAADENAGS
jgi:hypothetical protein